MTTRSEKLFKHFFFKKKEKILENGTNFSNKKFKLRFLKKNSRNYKYNSKKEFEYHSKKAVKLYSNPSRSKMRKSCNS